MRSTFNRPLKHLKLLFFATLIIVTVVTAVLYSWVSGAVSSNTLQRRKMSNEHLYRFSQPPTEKELTVKVSQKSADDGTCAHPPLDLYDPAIMQHYKKEPPLNCSSAMKEWVYVTNGTFRISREAIKQYGEITCAYTPILRRGDYDLRYVPIVEPMLDGTPLDSDIFRVFCESTSGKRYNNIHAAVAWNQDVMTRLTEYHSPAKFTADHLNNRNKMSSKTLACSSGKSCHGSSFANLSVFLLGFDSVSKMDWRRHLPKSHRYFTSHLGAIELDNYNVMGPGSASTLLPMLTGQKKEELPEARPGYEGAKPIDGYPWIWKEFSEHGYVTAFGQDKPSIDAFHSNMKGFESQPTDHYMRPFYLAADRETQLHPDLCWGSKPRHVNFMNWFGSLFDMYRHFPTFFLGHYVEMSHEHCNQIQGVDDDLLAFLQELERKGHLNSTLMILYSDHGRRFGPVRQTAQGVMEMRLPYFAFRFPLWFHQRYPYIIKTMETNTRRLTTPLDIHATLKDVLHYSSTQVINIRNRAISLFTGIPKERTCTDAGITPHWCTCLLWEPVSVTDPLVKQAVDTAIKTINSYTESNRKKIRCQNCLFAYLIGSEVSFLGRQPSTFYCAELKLQKITRGTRYTPSSEDIDAAWQLSRMKDSETRSLNNILVYKVSFKTLPGGGHFEVTCDLSVMSMAFIVTENQISRIDRYGFQPACIQVSKPQLRPYCYCEQQQDGEEEKKEIH